MEKNTRDLIIDFLTARIMQQRRYWEITSKKPDSVFLHSQFHLNQDFQKRRVRFQPEFQTLLFLRKNPNTFSSIEPDPFLVQAWSQTLNAPTSEATSLLNQFGNFMVTDHRRRYGPLSRPQVRFLKKAAEVLEEAIQRGAYPHWSRTFVV